jgi:hypothetical protein
LVAADSGRRGRAGRRRASRDTALATPPVATRFTLGEDTSWFAARLAASAVRVLGFLPPELVGGVEAQKYWTLSRPPKAARQL